MVLHAECGKRAMLETFNGIVVEVDVRDVHIVQIEAFGIHREAVVLRRDFHLLPLDVQHRMISAVMPELQLVCPASEGESENLVSEANAEHRLLAEKMSNVAD